MTENQSAILVKNPNAKKALVVLEKYAKLETQLKAAKAEAEEATELIKNAMIEAGVPKVEFDTDNFTGYITLAERTNYRAEDLSAVHGDFLKSALDTDKVKAAATLTGQIPDGVVESKTQYITKKFKAVE